MQSEAIRKVVMAERKPFGILVSTILVIIAAMSLTGCAFGQLAIEGDGTDTLTVSATEKTRDVTVASLQTDSKFIAIIPDVEEGDMMVSVTDGDRMLYKYATFDSSSQRQEIFEVDPGTIAVAIDAHDAKGSIKIQGVTVLDGPGTAGS